MQLDYYVNLRIDDSDSSSCSLWKCKGPHKGEVQSLWDSSSMGVEEKQGWRSAVVLRQGKGSDHP